MTPERWRVVPGFPDYHVSDRGQVRLQRGGAVRMLRRSTNQGYRTVALRAGDDHRSFKVHALVLSAFVGPRPEGAVTRHLDGDRGNNVLANLRWGTHAENAADRRRHGTEAEGERNFGAKLTEGDVHEIRRLAATGDWSTTALGRRFSVTGVQICRVMTGEAWAWLETPGYEGPVWFNRHVPTRTRFVEAWNSGVGADVDELAQALGMTRKSVLSYASKLRGFGYSLRDFRREREIRIAELWRDGLLIRDIAAEVGMMPGTVNMAVVRMRAAGQDLAYRNPRKSVAA